MKVLHTSDWHLGQVLFNYDRLYEQKLMLQQIRDIVEKEQPDVMVICGDIFHTGSPSSAAQKMYNDSLLDIHISAPFMEIIVIAGNHDSGAKLTVDGSLWEHFHVHVIGNISKQTNGLPDFEKHIFPIYDKKKNLSGYVAAVPHTYPCNFPTFNDEVERDSRQNYFFQTLLNAVKEKNTAQLPVVLMAHLAVTNCNTLGHELVGGMDYTPLPALGVGYDYLALGHIHCPQTIDKACYCGTPLAINFGENFSHTVSIIEMEKDKELVHRKIEISNPIPLITFPEKPLPFSEALQKLRDFPDDSLCYMRLQVKIDSSLTPMANEQINDVLQNKKVKFCRIFPVENEENKKDRKIRISLHEMQDKTPIDIARLYLQGKQIELTPEMEALMNEAIRQETETI